MARPDWGVDLEAGHPCDPATRRQRRRYLGGILLLLGAGVLWSLNGALIKLIFRSGAGPDGLIIAFYRSLFAGLFLVPLARGKFHTLGRRWDHSKRPGQEEGNTGRWGLQPAAIWCVVFFTLMTVCFVVANTKTEAANAIILQYTSTFWVFGLSPWLLKERPRAGDAPVLALAVVGILVIFFGKAETNLGGLVIALAAGLFFGLLTLAIRQLRNSDSAALTVFNNLGSAALMLPFVLLQGGLMVSPRAWILLTLMGVVQFGVPYYLYTLGLKRVPAYQAAFITMVEPVLVPVWAYCAVGETAPITTIIGGAIILGALCLFGRSARRAYMGSDVSSEQQDWE